MLHRLHVGKAEELSGLERRAVDVDGHFHGRDPRALLCLSYRHVTGGNASGLQPRLLASINEGMDEPQKRGEAVRTQVVIIGAGPAGLLLGQLLHTPASTTSSSNRKPGLRARPHPRRRAGTGRGRRCWMRRRRRARCIARAWSTTGIELAFGGERHRIDFKALTGKTVMVYGQTEVTRDLMDARAATGAHHRLRGRGRQPARFRHRQPARVLSQGRRGARDRLRLHRRLRRLPRRQPPRDPRGPARRPTSASIRSAGSACWSTSRRSRTN